MGKPKDDFISVRIPKDLKKALEKEAALNERTMNSQVIFLIRQGLEVLGGARPA